MSTHCVYTGHSGHPSTGLLWGLSDYIMINKIWEIPNNNICYMSDVLDGYADDGLQTLKLTGSWRLGRMGQLAEASLAPAPGGSVLIR